MGEAALLRCSAAPNTWFAHQTVSMDTYSKLLNSPSGRMDLWSLTLVQRPFVKFWIEFNQKQVRINGKDHPVTSYMPHFGPGAHFLDYSCIYQKWPLNGPTFSSFPDLPISKKTGPQRKNDAHGPSHHIRLLSKCNFSDCIYNVLFTYWSNPIFLN